jgi:hypothetical protein
MNRTLQSGTASNDMFKSSLMKKCELVKLFGTKTYDPNKIKELCQQLTVLKKATSTGTVINCVCLKQEFSSSSHFKIRAGQPLGRISVLPRTRNSAGAQVGLFLIDKRSVSFTTRDPYIENTAERST